MQIFENNDLVAPIYRRAMSLLISKEFTDQQSGKVAVTNLQNSEQTNRRRELLAVEEEAKKNKIIKAHGENHFTDQVMSKFFAYVTAEVNKAFDNKENLYNNVLKIEENAPTILEILSVRAASINRITPLAKSLPWLATELVNLVNKPQYRKRADVQVSDASLALSYIGLDNLKLVIPTFMLKHWLPNSTAPYALMKRKLWNDSLAIAMSSSVLAKEAGLDEFTAFSAGMFSNLGLLAVSRCFLSTYSELHQKELKKAYENKDKKLHDTLVKFDASPELLLEQIINRSSKISADLVELMRFDRLRVTEAIFDIAYTEDLTKMCALAQVITKAKAYVAFRSLAKEELISSDEAKLLLTAASITPQEISLLKKSDIDHIKLNFK
ncbi:MAG: HDOD domain-containing protein [Colwellia sp.]|nr:HDOD domain-containing protein [Colwellia sp.]